jgi:hypothetical protein
MLIEAITISTILGGSAVLVWFAKSRFQPEIEKNLTKIETSAQKKETIVVKDGWNKQQN